MDARADLRAVRLPGRESRFREEPLRSVHLQVRDVLPQIQAEVGQEQLPYHIVGMCAGAVLAFQLAAALEQARGLRGPESLIVIDQPPLGVASHDVAEAGEIGDRASNAEWLSDVVGLPPEMITDEVLELFGPTIEADLTAMSSYKYSGQILAAGIVVLLGADEGAEHVEEASGWAAFTEGRCELMRTVAARPHLDAGLGTLMSQAISDPAAAAGGQGEAVNVPPGQQASEPADELVRIRAEVKSIWRQVLPATDPDGNSGFFDVGGTSVQTLRLLSLLNERFPGVFKLIDLYENPSIDRQARHIVVAASKDASTDARMDTPQTNARKRLADMRRARREATTDVAS
jgi:surfactin synthase thioesterase subunit